MATQSLAPPKTKGESPQNQVSKAAQPIIEDRQNAQAEAPKDISPSSLFVNSEPIREDQVQNAVKFLSHPKVRGSPVIYRRSFLERKGLTKEEIDEAFRLVPDPTSTVSTGQPALANQDGQSKSSSNVQQEASTQAMQPAAATPTGAISKLGTLAKSQFGWQQALLAVGLLAISGAGTAVIFKNAIVPRLRSWIRKVVSEEDKVLVKKTNSKQSLAEEATSAAKAAAAAAVDASRASQEMLITKNGEKRYFEELMSLLNVQVQEMKSMSNAIRNLEGKSSISGQEDNTVLVTNSKIFPPSYANGKADFNLTSARPLSPPASVEPSVAPHHPKSYMEEINDLPPNRNQPVPNPRVAPRPKPWDVTEVQNNANQVLQSQDNGPANNELWVQNSFRKISETESGDEYKAGSSRVPAVERPVQRSWVPPQPPPVAMAEAAAAIRLPKRSPFQIESLTDDQFLARSSELTDELQRITKISESGGVTEGNGRSSVLNTEANGGSSVLNTQANGGSSMLNTEIQREEDDSYFETGTIEGGFK